jgi:hypothetical protein
MAPVFLVTYQSTRQSRNETHSVEWVCDASYDSHRARQAFQAQFPTATDIRVQEAPC